ncbi:hypothetical protein GGI23_000616 [Coemansia sp. RSA 2559]|nr:hypothetical protein GGI23_000616 [Coemansia sp. RSA 2559]
MEIRTAFPDKHTVIRSDDAKSKLPYLTAVLYEVMRLHPAVGGYLPRAVPKEGAHLVNGEYFIPHGTEICVSLFACHRNKDTWNNPTEFDPDRFMGPDSEARMKDVLVFSSGVRICAGRHLAIVALYTALVNLILRYDFKLPDGKEPCRHSVSEIPGSAYFNYSPNNTEPLYKLVSQWQNFIVDVLLVAGTWLAAVLIQRSFFTSLRKIPGPPLNTFSNIPLNYNVACGRYHKYVESLHAKYGEVVRVGYNQVSVSNLGELKRILSTHDFRKGQMYEDNGIIAVNSFSATDPATSNVKRRQIGNSYSLPSVRLYEDKVLEHGVLSLVRNWNTQLAVAMDGTQTKKKALVNFYYGFHGLAFDIIGVLGFGSSFGVVSTGDTTIIDQVRKTLNVGILQSTLPLGEYIHRLFRDMVNSRDALVANTMNTIKERQRENAAAKASGKKGTAHVDVLQRLVNAHDPLTGEKLDDESVKAEMLIMLAAGTDTTSNTLVWATMCLLHHPNIYKRLRSDVRAAFPDRSTVIRYDMAKSSLPFLTAFLYEVLRMYPAVCGYLPRRVPDSGACLMGKYHVPHGTELSISISACHRNSNVWSDPQKFDPGRFMGPDAEDRIKDVLAFSTGVRVCIGRFLGLVELYTTMANLIHKYDFELPDHIRAKYSSTEEIPGSSFITLAPLDPKNDCWMHISSAG